MPNTNMQKTQIKKQTKHNKTKKQDQYCLFMFLI